MEIILGPFHPHLEDALVEEILRYKRDEPLSPLLVPVPSNSLRRRLKVLLAQERRLNLLNVHILTFHQLSLRLLEEKHGSGSQPLQDNALLEEILRQIIRRRLPGTEAFAGLDEKAGGCAALWQTLRDLKDGMVNPEIALEALRSDLFEEEAKERVERLFYLFQTFLSCSETWKLRDFSDSDLMALEQAPSSPYLQQFSRIFYYGFYDLTQVQLDLFQTVTRHYPTTLFFPLLHEKPQHPAWTFAERFYERYLHGLADGQSRIRNLTLGLGKDPSAPHTSLLPLFDEGRDKPGKTGLDDFPVTIFSCFSGRDEIDTAAKEILRLVSEEGMAFDEIGVVGRSLDSYIPWIKQIFSEHSIPFATSAEEPLVQYPISKAVLLLINLPLKGYLRSQVIDLLGSPFFYNRSLGREGMAPRPDHWDLLTRQLGISKGIEEWRRVEKQINRDASLNAMGDDEEEPRSVAIPASEARALWSLFAELHRDLERLPREASWSSYVEAWRTLFKKWLGIGTENGSEKSSRRLAEEAVLEVLERLSALDVVGERTSLGNFLQTCQHWLERSSVPLPDDNVKGVAVLDAMAARGISFRALFIIGLNEGLFPRTIREDAFLRDLEREQLETVLGFKVATKLGGFDEERLLFTLLIGAAKERLYVLYQRNDESGRPLAPSWYLAELGRVFDREENRSFRKISVPRGIVEKEFFEPFDRRDLSPPRELAVRLILKLDDPMPLVDGCLPSPSLYRRGSQVIQRLESTAGRLAEYDGILGSAPDYWKHILQEGVAPTSLEGYARCPFQFFARTLLKLDRLERPEEGTGPGAADLGQIVHSILKSFYQELIDRGFFLSKEKNVDPAAILRPLAQKVFFEFEQNNPIAYPLAWEVQQEEITTLLERVVTQDLREIAESGYHPVVFEFDAADSLPADWPSPLSGLTIRGRMDRIDYRPEDRRYRVIDYKLKSKKSRPPEDKHLLRSALRGQRLQPPFYLLLGKKYAYSVDPKSEATLVDAAFYFLAPRWSDGPLVVETFPADGWEGESGQSLKASVASLVEGIRQGLFFIQPGAYCEYCEVREICRKNHRPTAWRAEKDPRTEAHLALREKEPEKG